MKRFLLIASILVGLAASGSTVSTASARPWVRAGVRGAARVALPPYRPYRYYVGYRPYYGGYRGYYGGYYAPYRYGYGYGYGDPYYGYGYGYPRASIGVGIY